MKPDWKDAPTWATHLAMDDDGMWSWHELKPEKHIQSGQWISKKRMMACLRPSDFWKETLEERPE